MRRMGNFRPIRRCPLPTRRVVDYECRYSADVVGVRTRCGREPRRVGNRAIHGRSGRRVLRDGRAVFVVLRSVRQEARAVRQDQVSVLTVERLRLQCPDHVLRPNPGSVLRAARTSSVL
jgi:hypothetical protein